MKKIMIFFVLVIVSILTFRTIKTDIQVGELTLPISFYSSKSIKVANDQWNLILVDNNHPIKEDNRIELVELANGVQVDARIYSDLQDMLDDARGDGLALFVREGYRTDEDQQNILDSKIEEYQNKGYSTKKAKRLAKKYVALPGKSEHQLGLSVDINADTSQSSFEQVYTWLNDHAYLYGFIKRYPANKTQITKISDEPWHYRYVGKEAAKVIKEEDLCLEEYLEKYQ